MIDQIRLDGGTQSRAAINKETVAEYAEQMEDETTVFPPVIVYHDGKDYWLADGFHRVEAWKRIGRLEVPAEVRQGDRRAAILHSCQANSAHGLRRSDEDKRRAVVTLLEDAEWSQWSDREIARRVRVSPTTVAKYRAEVGSVTVQMDSEKRTYTTKHGTTAQMDTSNIGLRYPEPVSGEVDEWEPSPTTDIPPNDDGGEDSGSGSDPVAPAPDPYGYAKLTEEALLEQANGLRASLDEEKAKRKKAEAEVTKLKNELTEIMDAGDQAEVVRRQSAKIRHLENKVWKANEEARRAMAAKYRAEERVRELEGAGVVTL